MQNRRTIMCSLGTLVATAPLARAADAVFPGKPTSDTPVATVIPGKPPVLDFGDGLKIPCSKAAFFVLWEGKTFWLTFGAGRSSYSMQAQGQAVKYASAAMKLLLMTLAFAPDRMEKADGGWHMKPGLEKNFVRGDIALPGKPYWPITDAYLGFGDMDSQALTGSDKFGGVDVNPSMLLEKPDAFTTYIVLKKDISLEDVRARAEVLLQ